MNATVSPIDGNAQVVRTCLTAFEKKDRTLLESILAPDFTFSSPLDDYISRERFFECCWPGSEHVSAFEIQKLFVPR